MADAGSQSENVLCFVCNKTAVKKRIYCTDCRVWSHISCADKKKCCVTSVSSVTPENIDENIITIKNLAATLNMLSSTVAEIKDVMSELMNENKKLRKEIEELKAEKMEENKIIKSGMLNRDEIYINEAVDRIKRSNNVIIRGIRESTGGTEQQNKSNDNEVINKMLTSIIPENLNYRIVSIGRLGKFDTAKTRPVKVTFDSAHAAQYALRHKPKNSNIFINEDLTRMQQNIAYATRKEYRKRIADGENDIRLKYFDGVPKIISKN